jgi:hypothetical protein
MVAPPSSAPAHRPATRCPASCELIRKSSAAFLSVIVHPRITTAASAIVELHQNTSTGPLCFPINRRAIEKPRLTRRLIFLGKLFAERQSVACEHPHFDRTDIVIITRFATRDQFGDGSKASLPGRCCPREPASHRSAAKSDEPPAFGLE